MKVLVNGVGNIGTTLLNILNDYRELLGIKEIYAKKNILKSWDISDLRILENKGIKICLESLEDSDIYGKELNTVLFDSIKDDVNYIFETTANKIGMKNLPKYKEMSNLIGVSAQGSEKGFGIPYALGVNDDKIKREKFE